MSIRPHLSATQLDSYCKCPEAYRRRYLEGEKIPPGIALLKGKGFHKGAETNMRQKIESHRDMPAGDVVDVAVAAFDDEAKGGFVLGRDEQARGPGAVIGEAKDSVASLVGVHAKQQAPDYQPVMVEETVRLELPGPRDLLAVIDLVDDQDRVTDFKTGGKRKSQSDADDSVQLTIYSGAFAARTGRLPSEVRLDTAVDTKTKSYRDVVTSSRDEKDFDALAARINVVTAAIEGGAFPPATPGAWWCSARWCGYHATCPFVNPSRGRRSQND